MQQTHMDSPHMPLYIHDQTQHCTLQCPTMLQPRNTLSRKPTTKSLQAIESPRPGLNCSVATQGHFCKESPLLCTAELYIHSIGHPTEQLHDMPQNSGSTLKKTTTRLLGLECHRPKPPPLGSKLYGTARLRFGTSNFKISHMYDKCSWE
jgi:hypothetical protein